MKLGVSVWPPNLSELFMFMAPMKLVICMIWLLRGGRDAFLSFNGGVFGGVIYLTSISQRFVCERVAVNRTAAL